MSPSRGTFLSTDLKETCSSILSQDPFTVCLEPLPRLGQLGITRASRGEGAGRLARRRTPCIRKRLARSWRSGPPDEWVGENRRRSPCPAGPPAPPPALPGPPHPSPGTSRSFSPRACSWLAKLTNSSSQPPPPPGSGRFRRSLARARRAARSSRLRSASAFRLPLPGRLFAACFRDMALAPRPAAAGGRAAGPPGGRLRCRGGEAAQATEPGDGNTATPPAPAPGIPVM